MSRAIGVFDSGLGGLTVVRAIRQALPHEDLIYLGDLARLPYGARGPATVQRYAQQCAACLQARGIRALVVACNTASAHALEALQDALPMPVLGVIKPGAAAAVAASRSGRIGVVATRGTIASQAYPRAIRALRADAQVLSEAAPLWVPLVEEGWLEGDITSAILQHHLRAFLPADGPGIDVLVLGCTHYPLLRPALADALQRVGLPHVAMVDSAAATAGALQQLLPPATQPAATQPAAGSLRILLTDAPGRFLQVATQALGMPLDASCIETIDL